MSTCYEPATEKHQATPNPSLSLMWVNEDVYLPPHSNAIYLYASPQELLAFGAKKRCGYNRLNAFDVATGGFLRYEQDVTYDSGINHTTANSQYIVWGFSRTGKAGPDISQAGGISVYDRQLGDVIWRQRFFGPRAFVLQDNLILVVESDLGWPIPPMSYLIEAKNGRVLESVASPVPMTSSPYPYLYSSLGVIPSTDMTDWLDTFQNVYQSPIVQEPYIILRENDGANIGIVSLFDKQEGNLMWSSSQVVVSNATATEKFVFYLTDSAELIAADLHTGQTIASVTFTPAQVQLGEDRGFYVAANESNQIFVYFGDSRQLSLLRSPH